MYVYIGQNWGIILCYLTGLDLSFGMYKISFSNFERLCLVSLVICICKYYWKVLLPLVLSWKWGPLKQMTLRIFITHVIMSSQLIHCWMDLNETWQERCTWSVEVHVGREFMFNKFYRSYGSWYLIDCLPYNFVASKEISQSRGHMFYKHALV